MGLARGYGSAHEPVAEFRFARETNIPFLFVPRVENFAELQSPKACFLQSPAQFERIVEFLAVFALGIEPGYEVVGAPLCPSLSAAQRLFFVVGSFALPVEYQSTFIEH